MIQSFNNQQLRSFLEYPEFQLAETLSCDNCTDIVFIGIFIHYTTWGWLAVAAIKNTNTQW
jgi:hypothetical protein